MTNSSAIPAGWLPADASRSPLRLVNAYAFSKSSTPPVDQWLHFAQLRPVPWNLTVIITAIAVVSLWGSGFAVTEMMNGHWQVLFVLVICGAGTFYFGGAAIKSLLSHSTRASWPHPHGVGIGESGISYRLSGGDSDVPWDAVTAVRATVTNETNPKQANIPVLRVEYAGTYVDLNTQIIGASPSVLYWALLFYWKSPALRVELGTTAAQQRMDGWLAEAGVHTPSGLSGS
jgi:hypothetical protein